MQFEKITNLWMSYRAHGVDPAIHPDDHMWKTSPRIDDYNVVGESGARVISSVLMATPKEAVWRILDFGCGHGRVARHIRALFPKAELFLCDIDAGAAGFCADQFQGVPVPANDDFARLELPEAIDLIWVGSVFTHIDRPRTEALFDALFGSLGPGGILIATFRGRRMYEQTLARPDQAQQFSRLLEAYEQEGFGWQSYGRADLGADWGLSLTSIERVVELGHRDEKARLVGYVEAGWANVHDVAAWMKL